MFRGSEPSQAVLLGNNVARPSEVCKAGQRAGLSLFHNSGDSSQETARLGLTSWPAGAGVLCRFTHSHVWGPAGTNGRLEVLTRAPDVA